MENITLEDIKQQLLEFGYEDSVVLEDPSYETAVIGVDCYERVVYDYDKMVQYLMDKDGMTQEESMEFIDYNTVRALPYMGDRAPIIIYNIFE